MSTTTSLLVSTLCTHLYVVHHLAHPGGLLHCRLAIRFGEQYVPYWLPIRQSSRLPLGLLPFLLLDGELLNGLSAQPRHWLLQQGAMQVQRYSLY